MRRSRETKTPASQTVAGVVHEDTGARRPTVDDAAGGGDQTVDGGAGGGDPAAAKENPRKFCWNCQAPDHAVELQKCSGCKRVRHTTYLFSQKT